MYTGFERLWNALALFGLGAEAFGVDGNFDGNKFFCYYSFLTRRSSSFVFRVSDCHQSIPSEDGNPHRLPFLFAADQSPRADPLPVRKPVSPRRPALFSALNPLVYDPSSVCGEHS